MKINKNKNDSGLKSLLGKGFLGLLVLVMACCFGWVGWLWCGEKVCYPFIISLR